MPAKTRGGGGVGRGMRRVAGLFSGLFKAEGVLDTCRFLGLKKSWNFKAGSDLLKVTK